MLVVIFVVTRLRTHATTIADPPKYGRDLIQPLVKTVCQGDGTLRDVFTQTFSICEYIDPEKHILGAVPWSVPCSGCLSVFIIQIFDDVATNANHIYYKFVVVQLPRSLFKPRYRFSHVCKYTTPLYSCSIPTTGTNSSSSRAVYTYNITSSSTKLLFITFSFPISLSGIDAVVLCITACISYYTISYFCEIHYRPQYHNMISSPPTTTYGACPALSFSRAVGSNLPSLLSRLAYYVE